MSKDSQPKKVLRRLQGKSTITSIEAIGLYGITRLAAVVYVLRKRGLKILSVDKKGVNGTYTSYTLATQ